MAMVVGALQPLSELRGVVHGAFPDGIGKEARDETNKARKCSENRNGLQVILSVVFTVESGEGEWKQEVRRSRY